MNNGDNSSTPFDPALVQRANDSSVAFNFGDSIVQKYNENVTEISKMQHFDEEKRAKAIKVIHALRTGEMISQGKATGPNTYGPAAVNSDKDSKNFDANIIKGLLADKFMNSLRSNEEKYKISQKKVDLVEFLKNAAEQGENEVVINNKTFYRSGKTWTTKIPKEKNRRKE